MAESTEGRTLTIAELAELVKGAQVVERGSTVVLRVWEVNWRRLEELARQLTESSITTGVGFLLLCGDVEIVRVEAPGAVPA